MKIRIQNLARANADQTALIAEAIIAAMTGNENFDTPDPTLASITTKTNAVKAKSVANKNLEFDLTTGRGELKDLTAELKSSLLSLADYVADEADGDVNIVHSAGMTVAGERTPVGPMTQVQNLKVSVTDSEGTLSIEYKPVTGAFAYLIETATDPNGSWAQATATSKSRLLLPGLTPGTKYWVRVRAVGAAGLGPYSDPACKIAA